MQNLVTLFRSEGGRRGRLVWRQLNNKKWAVRNFGSAANLKVAEDGGIAGISRKVWGIMKKQDVESLTQNEKK